MVKECNKRNCVSEYQDRRYGKGMRVHTVGKQGDERCTVCGPKPRDMERLRICANEADKTPPVYMPSNKAKVLIPGRKIEVAA